MLAPGDLALALRGLVLRTTVGTQELRVVAAAVVGEPFPAASGTDLQVKVIAPFRWRAQADARRLLSASDLVQLLAVPLTVSAIAPIGVAAPSPRELRPPEPPNRIF